MNNNSVRDYAVALDGLVMTFECGRAGHRYSHDYGAARLPSQRLSEFWLKRMLTYWGRQGGGVSAFKAKRQVVNGRTMRVRACSKCRRELTPRKVVR